MGYTTNPVVAIFVRRSFPAAQGGFHAGSTPTNIEVDTLIEGVSAEIDVHLGSGGYTIPVTTPATFLTWLGLVCCYGVAAEVLKIFAPESVASENGAPPIPAYAFWESRYKAAIKAIDERTIVPDAASATDLLARSYLTDNPDNFPRDDGSTDGQQPVFSMGRSLREF